jgi:hypothetical protein
MEIKDILFYSISRVANRYNLSVFSNSRSMGTFSNDIWKIIPRGIENEPLPLMISFCSLWTSQSHLYIWVYVSLLIRYSISCICELPSLYIWVYVSLLIRYSISCISYQGFIDRGLLQTRKLLKQGFLVVKSRS